MGLDHANDAYMWYRTEATNAEIKDHEAEQAYAESSSSMMKWDSSSTVAILDSEDEEELVDGTEKPELSVDDLKDANSPEKFYLLGQKYDWVLPPSISTIFKKRVKSGQYRPDTVGAWLKTMLQ